MGILKVLSEMFGVEKAKNLNYGTMSNGMTPIYSGRGQNIYMNDVVQQTLDCIVNELKKLNPTHVRYEGFDPVPVDGPLQQVLNDPNPLMTTSEFIEKWAWMLLLTYNAFIYVQRDDKGTVTGYYPLNPQQVTFMETPDGKLYLKLRFGSGYESTIPYDSIIHLKTHFAQNDLMGGNEYGQPDQEHIKKTIGINDDLLEGLRKAMKVSCAVNGVVKYKVMMDEERMKKNIEVFEKKLQDSESGLLPMDTKEEYLPLNRDIRLVDKDTLEFLDKKIMRNWHVPANIVLGSYKTEEYASFYQAALEPIIISASQGFTKKTFTKQQAGGYKNKIMFFMKELIFADTSQTLAVVKELAQTGALFENEKRVAFGFAPDIKLKGQRKQSLNWIDAEYATEYQLKKRNESIDERMQELIDIEYAKRLLQGEG